MTACGRGGAVMAGASSVAGGVAVAVCTAFAGVAADAAPVASIPGRSGLSVSVYANGAGAADARLRAVAEVLAVGVVRLLVAGRTPTPQAPDTSSLVAPLLSRSPSLIRVDVRALAKRSLVQRRTHQPPRRMDR